MPQPRIPHPVRAARNAAYRIAATLTGVEALRAELAQLRVEREEMSARVADLGALMGDLGGRVERLGRDAREEAERDRQKLLDTLEHNRGEMIEILQLLRDDEPETRRRLWAVRETQAYMEAYEEAEPLVTVTIPTYSNTELLIERALPSVLAQTYERLEVVIVGDHVGPEVEQAIRRIGDGRIRYANLTHRGPYPENPELRWMVAGGPAANEATRLARGRWITAMDDDDACTPDRIELLLSAARERQLEFCYGRIRKHAPDGSIELLCEFPPRAEAVSLTCSISHAGLRFITGELGDALFGLVGDWARVRRMMRVGVRIGMIEDVVLDYYPGKLWNDI
jgi:Glycosyl transferase family 2